MIHLPLPVWIAHPELQGAALLLSGVQCIVRLDQSAETLNHLDCCSLASEKLQCRISFGRVEISHPHHRLYALAVNPAFLQHRF
ncbi:MAG: hypothetical protein N2A42_07785 [Luteolibacter sp.]